MLRRVLIHYHIFKNAGTSIDRSLSDFFGDSWTQLEGSNPHDVIDSKRLLRYLECNTNIKAVSSHLARPPLPFEGSLPIVMIREPLARAISVFNFLKRDKSQPSSYAACGSFNEFLAWALGGHSGSVVIRNYQVIHLSSASFHSDGVLQANATNKNFIEAKRLLQEWGIFGIVEMYKESVMLFEKIYGKEVPGLKLGIYRENESAKNGDEIAIDHDLLYEFKKANYFDFKLYEFARNKFMENINIFNIC